jgi:hypothetical protein
MDKILDHMLMEDEVKSVIYEKYKKNRYNLPKASNIGKSLFDVININFDLLDRFVNWIMDSLKVHTNLQRRCIII